MAKDAIARWSNPETILVVTDPFESHPLVHYAISLARFSGAKVLLVDLIPPWPLPTEVIGRRQFALRGPAIRTLGASLEETAEEFLRGGISCEPLVLHGRPEIELPRLVKSKSVDRVVIATRNTSGVARLTEEPVAEKLMAVLDVPVCVIGRRALASTAPDFSSRRILLATSLHSTSSMLADFANALAEVNHAHLTVLHVLVSNTNNEPQLELERMAARQRLTALVPNKARHRFQPLLLIREGDPAAIILDVANSLSQDVVIMGAPYISNPSRLISNSVVHRVVVDSRCPVITVRSAVSSIREEVHQMATPEALPTHS
jgi:nucleotide-binding universal stress UspA family protein